MNRLKRLLVFAVVLLLAASFSGCGGGNGNNLPPPPVKPTISISPENAATTLSGGQVLFNLKVTGTPSIECKTTAGIISLSGLNGTYSAPDFMPKELSSSITCTATNSAGSDETKALVSLSYPKPIIESFSPKYMPGTGGTTIEAIGSGFVKENLPGSGTGGILQDEFQGLCQPQPGYVYCFSVNFLDSNHVTWGSSSYLTRPQKTSFWLVNPSPGGGQTEKMTVTNTGNLNTAIAADKIYVLDEVNYQVKVFDLNGTELQSIPVGISGTYVNHLAYDSNSGYLLVSFEQLISGPSSVGIIKDGQIIKQITDQIGDVPLGIAALENFAVVANYQSGDVSLIDLTTLGGLSRTAVGQNAWATAMTKINNQLMTLVLTRTDSALSIFSVPDMTLRGFLNLNIQEPTQLSVLLDKAAVLSESAKKLLIIDLNTMKVLKEITFEFPIRLAADNLTNSFWVVNFGGKIQKIDMATFTVSDHPQKATLTPVGFAIRNDKIYVSDEKTIEIIPK